MFIQEQIDCAMEQSNGQEKEQVKKIIERLAWYDRIIDSLGTARREYSASDMDTEVDEYGEAFSDAIYSRFDEIISRLDDQLVNFLKTTLHLR